MNVYRFCLNISRKSVDNELLCQLCITKTALLLTKHLGCDTIAVYAVSVCDFLCIEVSHMLTEHFPTSPDPGGLLLGLCYANGVKS